MYKSIWTCYFSKVEKSFWALLPQKTLHVLNQEMWCYRLLNLQKALSIWRSIQYHQPFTWPGAKWRCLQTIFRCVWYYHYRKWLTIFAILLRKRKLWYAISSGQFAWNVGKHVECLGCGKCRVLYSAHKLQCSNHQRLDSLFKWHFLLLWHSTAGLYH